MVDYAVIFESYDGTQTSIAHANKILRERILRLVKEGWVLQGGVSITENKIAQALIKEEDDYGRTATD